MGAFCRAWPLRLTLAALSVGLALSACSSSGATATGPLLCAGDNDCPSDQFCVWPTTNACGQRGSCTKPPADLTTCAAGPKVCPCDATQPMQIATCQGAAVPVTGSLGCLHSPCTPGQTTCNAGLVCLGSECIPPLEGGALPEAGSGIDAAPAADAASE